ncbi:outer membrane protein assembly factor BamB [Celerinatantimonas yamalensis]|uniref:Outer membrane protein assembly factor BamB n=1 Tax=Celerinatantimonas yamalensis TaxID=559956 RepID=A0ABW9G9Y1_9GAMM
MRRAYQLLLASVMLLILAACSSDKPVHTPAATPEFTNQFSPVKAWSVSVGDGVGSYYSQLCPTVANGLVFAAARQGQLSAFNLKGQRVWQADVSDLPNAKQYIAEGSARLSGGLLAAYGMVYVGSENADLFAFDAKTGKLKWHQDMPGEVIAAPATGDDLLAVITNNGHLVTLDPQTGKIQWSITIDQPSLTLRGKAVPVISNGVVILGRSNGSVSFYSENNGQQLFNAQLAQSEGMTQLDRLVDVDSQPVLVGNDLYAISYNGSLMAVNLQNGQTSWKRSYSAYRDMALSGGELFLTDDSGHLIDLDHFTGSENWQQSTLSYRGVTAPAVAGNYVLVGDQEGYLYWISRDSGHFVAKIKVDSSGLYVAPVVTDNLIIVQTRSGRLIAFKRA